MNWIFLLARRWSFFSFQSDYFSFFQYIFWLNSSTRYLSKEMLSSNFSFFQGEMSFRATVFFLRGLDHSCLELVELLHFVYSRIVEADYYTTRHPIQLFTPPLTPRLVNPKRLIFILKNPDFFSGKCETAHFSKLLMLCGSFLDNQFSDF